MFKIRSFSIEGLWHRHDVYAEFNDEVNVVIGRNGTGKTTFMNILRGVLSVDIDALLENQFDSATVVLMDQNGKKKTIKAAKLESPSRPYTFVEYKISTRKFAVMLVPVEERRSGYVRRKAYEEASVVRESLRELLALASLSVYRIRNETEYDPRERSHPMRLLTPVDYRLTELTQQLTHYQLELSQQAQEISIELQKQVLASLLYEKTTTQTRKLRLEFNAAEERRNLQIAYGHLGVTGSSIVKRINEHVAAIESTVNEISKSGHTVNFAPLEARSRTDQVVRLSLDASKKTQDLYSQINLFLELIASFITDKKFSITSGDLVVEANGEGLPIEKLSSGEKQLLILLIEAVLQRQQPYVFLADEPELSLHIAWQRKIVPAVQKMNPNAQIIVATHSPEIAGRYQDSLTDMEDMIDGRH